MTPGAIRVCRDEGRNRRVRTSLRIASQHAAIASASAQTEQGGLTVSAADAIADEVGLQRARARHGVVLRRPRIRLSRSPSRQDLRRHRVSGGSRSRSLCRATPIFDRRRRNDRPGCVLPRILLRRSGGTRWRVAPRAGPNLSSQLLGEDRAADPEIPVRAAVDRPVVLAGIAGEESAWPVWREVLADGGRERVLREVDTARLRGSRRCRVPSSSEMACCRRNACGNALCHRERRRRRPGFVRRSLVDGA